MCAIIYHIFEYCDFSVAFLAKLKLCRYVSERMCLLGGNCSDLFQVWPTGEWDDSESADASRRIWRANYHNMEHRYPLCSIERVNFLANNVRYVV